MDDHTFLETIQMAIKLSKLEQHPVGSLWATMSDDDPAVVFGGGWKKLGECRVLQCADDDHPAGTTEEAGLPNTTGSIRGVLIYGSNNTTGGSGALSWKKENAVSFNGEFNGAHVWSTVAIDLSKGNSVYGKSDTVQMKSIYANIWQRIK